MDSQASLRDKLEDRDENVRAFAAEDAGFDDRADDVAPLAERLWREGSRHVREAIVTALSRMTHASVCEQALALLGADDAFLRNAGVQVLQSRGEAGVGSLRGAFESARSDADVREFLLDAASVIPGARAEAVLLAGLDDEDVNVRIAATEYLGERLRPDLKPHFEMLVKNERVPMLVSTALSALEEIGDEASWSALEARLLDPEGFPAFLAPQLLRVMAKCAPESSLDQFFAGLERLGAASLGDWLDGLETFHRRFAFRELSSAHFAILSELVTTCPSPLTRLRLLRLLGTLDHQAGLVPLLHTALQSHESMVRQGAALGLAEVGTPEARALLTARLSFEADEDVRATIVASLAVEAGTVA